MRQQRLLVSTAYDHSLAQRALAESLPDEVADGAASAYAVTAYNGLLVPSGKTLFVDKTPLVPHSC
jgi:hypothetical protein